MIQLPLFPEPIKLPDWWSAADAEIVAEYWRCESMSFADRMREGEEASRDRYARYTCRRCVGWKSADGLRGLCMRHWFMYERHEPDPRPPRECGAKNGCEEWYPNG